jgi:hypothetical protein
MCPEGFQKWWQSDENGVGPCILDGEYPWSEDFLSGKLDLPDNSKCTCPGELPLLNQRHNINGEVRIRKDAKLQLGKADVDRIRTLPWQDILVDMGMKVGVAPNTNLEIQNGSYIELLQDTEVEYLNPPPRDPKEIKPPRPVKKAGTKKARTNKAGAKISAPKNKGILLSLRLPPDAAPSTGIVFRAAPGTRIWGVRSGFQFKLEPTERGDVLRLLRPACEGPRDHNNDSPWPAYNIDKFPAPQDPEDFDQIREAVKKFAEFCRSTRSEDGLKEEQEKEKAADAESHLEKLKKNLKKAKKRGKWKLVKKLERKVEEMEEKRDKYNKKKEADKKIEERIEEERKEAREKKMVIYEWNQWYEEEFEECNARNNEKWKDWRHCQRVRWRNPIAKGKCLVKYGLVKGIVERLEPCPKKQMFLDGRVWASNPINPNIPWRIQHIYHGRWEAESDLGIVF